MVESKEGNHVDEGINNEFPDIETSNKWKEYDYMKELARVAVLRKDEKAANKEPNVFEVEVLPELLDWINDGEILKALQKYCFFTNNLVDLDEYPSYRKALDENPVFKDLVTLKKLNDALYKEKLKWEKEDLQLLIDTYRNGIAGITKTTSRQTSLVLSLEEN